MWTVPSGVCVFAHLSRCAVSLASRRACCVQSFVIVQVPLMGVLGTAVAALDAHRGLWEVAEMGLLFLGDLAVAPENHVRCHASGLSCWLIAFHSFARICSQVGLMGVLTSAMAALDASGEEADVALAGLHFLWWLAKRNTVNSVSVLYYVRPPAFLSTSWLVCTLHIQVPLMGVVDRVVRALGVHRGDVRVARVGLGLLTQLATKQENRVSVQSRRAILAGGGVSSTSHLPPMLPVWV